MKKYAVKLTMILAFIVLLAFPVLAADTPNLVDGANLLQGSEKIAVMNELSSIEKKYGVRVAVVTVPSTNGVKIGDYANKLLDSTFKDGQNGSMVLVLAMDTRDFYISTDNKMREKITDKAGIPALQEKFLPSLKENKYADAFKAYAQESGTLLAYYEENGEAYDPDSGFSVLALVIALVLGIGGGFLFRRYLISTMSNVTPAVAAAAYLDEDSFQLIDKEDTFLYTNVSRVAKSKPKHDSTDDEHGGGGGKF